MNNYINTEQMIEQEKKDFNITKKIMKKIFSTYGAHAKLEQTSIYSPYDALMTVTSGKKNIKKYAVEIKERNQNLEVFDCLPITAKKFIKVKDAAFKNNLTPIVIYLVNDEDYFIYDLNKLDLNKVELKNWNIKKVEYSLTSDLVPTPAFFLPLNQCIYNGQIPN